jgi:hypothetical protein
MTTHDTEAQLVIQILNQLEGHPNFVKANRILDELAQAKLISTDEKPRGSAKLELAARRL